MFRLLLLALLIPLSLTAQPRIAVVDIDAIYRGYTRKIELEKKIQKRLTELQKSPQNESVKEMDAKLSQLARLVRDKGNTIEVRETAANEFNSLAIEHQSLLKNVNENFRRNKKDTTEKLVDALEKLIAEIRSEIALVGEEKQFDLILESAGHSSSQVSPLIYIRDKTDITEIVLTRLNENAKSVETQSE